MQNKTITVQQALNELKVIDKRISRKLDETTYAGLVQQDKLVFPNNLGTDQNKFLELAKSTVDSVWDLIAYRNALKGALLVSNATTFVTIGDKTMSVAQAIDLKTANTSIKEAIYHLAEDLRIANDRGASINSRIDKELTERESDFLKGDSVKNDEFITFLRNESEKKKATLLEPTVGGMTLTDFVKAQIDSIEEFESNVDLVLTTSNVTTTITVEW